MFSQFKNPLLLRKSLKLKTSLRLLEQFSRSTSSSVKFQAEIILNYERCCEYEYVYDRILSCDIARKSFITGKIATTSDSTFHSLNVKSKNQTEERPLQIILCPVFIIRSNMSTTYSETDDDNPKYQRESYVYPTFSLPIVNQFNAMMRRVVILCSFSIFLGVILIAIGITSIFVPSMGSMRIYHPLWIGGMIIITAIFGIIGYRKNVTRPIIMHINLILNILSITATVGGCIMCVIAIIEGVENNASIGQIAAINICLILMYLIIFSSYVYCIIVYFLVIKSPVILITSGTRMS
ncbi:hypothetical protein TrispH2_005425 [Trichoplax sp. H2]|uniref:Uncharacterized protein n=1 Tax=Trichoplax adhaerens TaxID=10228 RepID=B3RZC6_TRIAD|nr:predicted protein [Trichoplax adhaerens]EDV23820.1 predicted protein [Trichoplax adhaerens]RDD42437.1 hypothetical protein TrispH2_005425 [Trichoplax sp. H2]|eukprot:XP_002113346.1 predicted protein [Trichoplax adhaerens]